MSPRNCNLGSAGDRLRQGQRLGRCHARLAGAAIHVDLHTQVQYGGSVSGRCALRRSAVFRRSTVCTQSKCSATRRVLLLWIGPMQCHCSDS
jgi:hypothetical protein